MTPFQSKVLMLARLGHVEPAISSKTGNPLKWMMGRINVTATIARLVSGGHLKVIRAPRYGVGGVSRLPRLE